MTNYNSDDEKETGSVSVSVTGSNAGSRRAILKAPSKSPSKYEPIRRERPRSATLFRDLSIDDPELKVFYRHANHRRMPATEEHISWVNEREKEFAKREKEKLLALQEAAAAKAEKAKGKDKGGDKNKKDKEDEEKKKKDLAKHRKI